jgi:peptidoglycan/LPS O-acetylase OafA/YrhL
MTSPPRAIASLDGLRALAVISVIFFHISLFDRFAWLEPFRNGALGVTCFFVISGFLITKLLVDERGQNGSIDLKRFYLRRAFRIFPPFYLYLLVIAILGLLHYVHVDLKSFILSAAYLRDYLPHPTIPVLEHIWSLSLEEQFYLIWPVCLFFFRPRVCLRIAVIAIVASPFIRLLTYALVPVMRDHINMMLHTRMDAIMVGAALTLAQQQGTYKRILAALANPLWLVPVALYFLAQPALTLHFRGTFSLLVGFSLNALGCGIVLLQVTSAPHTWLGKLLNLKWLRHLGIISYSLYLWQQLFTVTAWLAFPLNVVVIFLLAECSYWLIERPSVKLRNRLVPHRERLADVVQREDRILQETRAA